MVRTFACSFTATDMDARAGIADIVSRLRTLGVPGERADEVQIALTEAVNNVVEHAYAGTAPGDVTIGCQLHAEQLWVNIRDAGGPYPGGQLPDGKPADVSVPHTDLPEGGFGWFLIRELTSQIKYERTGSGNNLSLCFEIKLTGRPDSPRN
ncbi:ATP-binding protein [Cribrihabitans neustonicus]|uniref:ATP-binding protein n=1 Tax=Cribrihabitans neustonicus TaxID=1429085 RepID=UPI003B5B4409